MRRINPDRPLTPAEASARYREKHADDPRWREKRVAEARAYRYESRYGLTVEQFDELSRSQQGRCAACGAVPKGRLHVDHSHETGEVRGLLCGPCNRALGHIESVRYDLLITYLNEHGGAV